MSATMDGINKAGDKSDCDAQWTILKSEIWYDDEPLSKTTSTFLAVSSMFKLNSGQPTWAYDTVGKRVKNEISNTKLTTIQLINPFKLISIFFD